MNNNGTNDPAALVMQISTVTSWPLSSDDATCFLPRHAMILDGRLGTVVTPVSSTLWTRSGVHRFSSWTVSNKSKKALTVPWLNALARAADVKKK